MLVAKALKKKLI